MARPTRDPRDRPERPGQKPLLQGHLKPGGARLEDAPQSTGAPGEPGDQRGPTARSAQPADDPGPTPNDADATRGKATKSPADVATRPHLEGAEQGPM